MRARSALMLATALGMLGGGPALAAAQEPGRTMQEHQHQMMMQQQMQQLGQTMDRMARIQERAQTMAQQMAQAMEQNQGAAAMSQEQMRSQERLHTMAQAMDDGARQMHQAMEQLRDMMGDPAVAGNGDLQRDMDRLRQHWDDMAGQMEESLQIMDRLRDRLHVPGEGN